MASEIKVDTVSEKTSGSGVTIDGLLIKDGGISGDVSLIGTTPTFTIGDAGAEDAALVFDGNAQDFYIALDDSADDLVIGKGSTVGTTPAVSIDENLQVIVHDNLSLLSDSSVLKFGADGDTTLTHTDGTGLTLNSTNKLCFQDTGTYVGSNADGDIDVVSDGTAVDSINLESGGGITLDAGSTTHGITYEDDGTAMLRITNSSSDVVIKPLVDAKDIIFQQYDGRALLDINDGGFVGIYNGATGPGEVRIYEDTDLGSHYTGFKAGNATASVSYVLPVADGSDGQGLLTDGSGTLSWGSAGASLSNDGNNRVVTGDGSGGLNGEANLLFDGSALATGAEGSPDVVAGGITINTGANDAKLFSLKNSDVSHGFTGLAEADTHGHFEKCDSSLGGLNIAAYKENGIQGLFLEAFCDGNPDFNTSNSVNACIEFAAYERSGTGSAYPGNASDDQTGNIMCAKGGTVTQFIWKNNGHFYANAGNNTFDAYDDAHLIRALDLSHGKGVIESKFDKFVGYNHEKLAELKLVGREDDGTPNHFINVTGFQQLHNGAIWQQYEKHNQLLEAVYDLAKEAVGEEKADAILDKHDVKRLQ